MPSDNTLFCGQFLHISDNVHIVKVGRSYVYDLSTKLPCVTFFTKVITQMVQFLSYSRSGDTLVAYDDAIEQELVLNEG